MRKPKTTSKPAAAPAPKPLTLADLTVSHVRFSPQNRENETWSFSAEQLAFLLAANESEGNLEVLRGVGQIASEIRGIASCIDSLSFCRLTCTEVDEAGHGVALDFLQLSLQRIADRVQASRAEELKPEQYRVEIGQAPARLAAA